MRISAAWKTVVAAVGSLVVVMGDVIADDVLSLDDAATLAGQIVVAVGTIVGVWAVRNKPQPRPASSTPGPQLEPVQEPGTGEE